MKSTKKAFVSALVALIVCFTMLVGTTLAWFTDSANVGIETIQTGTLNLTVEDGAGDDANLLEGQMLTWQAFDGRTDIYWEPGATYETNEFYIKNRGNLNLKFKIALDEFEGDTELLDVLTFDIIADAHSVSFAGSSATYIPAVGTMFDLLEGYYVEGFPPFIEEALYTEYTLNAGAYIGPLKVVAHMDENAGNEYMNKSLTGIGFTIIATQGVGDQDSYDGTYDENAEYPSVGNTSKDDNVSTTIDADNVSIELPANAPAGNYTMSLSNQSVTTENGETTISFDLDLFKDNEKVSEMAGVSYPVSLLVGTDKYITSVKHNGEEITEFEYDPAITGILTFETSSFSPFAVSFTDAPDIYPVDSASLLVNVLKASGKAILECDITLPEGVSAVVAEGADVELDLNGKTITGNILKGDGHVVKNNGILKISNGTVKNVMANGGSAIFNAEDATLTVANVTAIGASIEDSGWPSYAVNNYGTMTMSDCVVESMHGSIASCGSTAVATLDNVKATVFPNGEATKISSHVLYTSGNGSIVVNSGEYTNNASNASSFGGSIVLTYESEKDVIINNGTFKGGCGLRGKVSVVGGLFDKDPKDFLADGYVAVKGEDGMYSIKDGAYVADATELQAALDATKDYYIIFTANITGDVQITQKENVDIIIEGNNKTYNGVMTVFGNGRQKGAETLEIKNIKFSAKAGAGSCIVSPDRTAQTPATYSYAHNVTVDNCTFTDTDGTVNCAAVRHEDGGDMNWVVKNCTVDNTMHSLLQVNNVAGKLTIENCEVYSKNGANLNSCTNVEISGSTFDVKGYAVRFGVSTGGNLGEAKQCTISNSTLKSAVSESDDAVIVLRASAVDIVLNLTDECELVGTPDIIGATDATTINR